MDSKYIRISVMEGAMPTVLEIHEPEISPEAKLEAKSELRIVKPAEHRAGVEPRKQQGPAQVLFSDSLLESAGSERKRRSLATTFSFAFQCVLLGVLLIAPLMFTEALPTQQFLTFLVAPPPPPPPPPPAAAVVKVVRQTDMLNNGQLRTPTRIPKKVEIIREEEAPPPMAAGVVGGVPGGIPGGQLGGVIGGIISSTPTTAFVPKLEQVKRVRMSQGVTKGMVLRKIEPKYPKLALAAHITGVVLLKAVINGDGEIKELQVVSGHPILVPAAMDAVKQWRYRPYLLNGEPVEVETNITVTFQIAG
jgi:protein TonB